MANRHRVTLFDEQKIGLGTGSTAAYAVERVGELYASGELKDIVCVPTSVRTKEQVRVERLKEA